MNAVRHEYLDARFTYKPLGSSGFYMPEAPSPLLAGRKVALVHPAWHSCGTYRVVLGQIAAYRALGAEVFPIAVSSDPGFAPNRRWIWRGFVEATPELDAQPRYFGGAPFRAVLGPDFLTNVLWPYIHGDQAVIRSGLRTARCSGGRRRPGLRSRSLQSFFLMRSQDGWRATREDPARQP